MRTLLALLLALTVSQPALAGIIIESTRIVFPGNEREISLQLANGNKYPVVVQTWVDNGSPDGTPDTAGEVPVIPLPGLFRLAPGEKKSLRLLSTQIPQPKDRESLYWLNVVEIPPASGNKTDNVTEVNVSLRLQLKLFYRPARLNIKPDDVAKSQRFSLVRTPGLTQIKVENPTPYYATYSAAQVGNVGLAPGMLAPFSSKLVPVDSSVTGRVNYTLIGDDGNGIAGTQPLR